MYPSSGATIRADLNIKVEEAAAADSFHIGHLVMPPMSVDAKSGTYAKLQLAEAELLSVLATERSEGGSYGEVTRKWTSDTYDCVDRGLEERVDDATASDVGRFFNQESAAARLTMRNVHLGHENRVQAAIFNTTNFGAATNSTVAYTVANLATIDVVADVLAGIDRVEDKGARANTIVLGKAVFTRIAQAPKLQSWLRGTVTGNISVPMNAQNIARSFGDYGIENVYIGRARYNTAKKGQAYSAGQIWGTGYIWIGYVNPGARIPQDGGAGFTLYWNAEGGLFVTETYRVEHKRSNMVRVRQNTSEKVTDGTCGTLINPQYS